MISISGITGVALLSLTVLGLQSVRAGSPRLTQTISLPGVEGRIDHLAVDVAGQRLFVCALGNNTLEVIDLKKGERVHSLRGLSSPQGVAFSSEPSRLYVANDSGKCNIYDGNSLALLSIVDFEEDADNVRYDSSARRIYVGYGSGGIGVIDANNGKNIGSVELSKHPEAFALERSGHRIFVNVPAAQEIAVIDRVQGKTIANWKPAGALGNYPIALDETNHRLFVGCRSPPEIVVLNADSGSVVTTVTIPGDTDDVFYDEKSHRLYAICGDGAMEVIDQVDRDSYEISATINVASGARTGLFVPEFRSLFVAVPHRGSQIAEVRRYSVE